MEIATAFLRNTRFGVAFIKLTQLIPFSRSPSQKNKITARAAGSLLSPCTIISLFLLVVDHVDNTGGRRHSEQTKVEDDGEASDGNEQEPGKMRRVLGCDVATMHVRQHNQP